MTALPQDLAALLPRLFAPDALEAFERAAPPPGSEAFFARLLAARPGQCDAIAAVYEATHGKRLGAGPAAAPLSGRHPAMSEELADALRHCAGHGYATGWGELSTTTVFQVYRWRQPWVLPALPDGALREVEPEYTGQVGDPFSATVFSDCVRRSLGGLCAHAQAAGVQVTFHDLFFDLARFGTGRCVQRLRDHGVGQAELRAFTERLGLGRLTRHGMLEG